MDLQELGRQEQLLLSVALTFFHSCGCCEAHFLPFPVAGNCRRPRHRAAEETVVEAYARGAVVDERLCDGVVEVADLQRVVAWWWTGGQRRRQGAVAR